MNKLKFYIFGVEVKPPPKYIPSEVVFMVTMNGTIKFIRKGTRYNAENVKLTKTEII